MRIAVTGATGFVGGHVVRRLVNDGHAVYAFGRRPCNSVTELGCAGCRSWDLASGRLSDAPAVDAVVHCAAKVSDWGPYRELYAANVEGTRAVLETFRDVPRFVHVSSASVYDPRVPRVMVRESAAFPASYFNAYARTKMLAERLLMSANRPVIILRPHAVYGPGDTTLLPRLLKPRRFGRLMLVGDGRNRISVTHVDNLVDAIVQGITAPCERGTFNICDDVAPRVDDAIRHLLAALHLKASVHYLPAKSAWPLARACEATFRAARVPSPPPISRYLISQLATEYTLDTERARTHLEYHPVVDYRSGFATLTMPVGSGQW